MRKAVKNGLPEPPKNLSLDAKKLWTDLVAEYTLTDVAGMAILEAGLESFDRARAAKELLDVEGMVVEDRWSQKKSHPATAIERDSRAAWLSALKMLNLDIEPLKPGPGRPSGGGML